MPDTKRFLKTEFEAQLNSSLFPGMRTIGAGFDATSEFCSPDGLRSQIIDLGENVASGVDDLMISERLELRDAASGMAEMIETSTMNEFHTELTARFQLDGSYGAFKGEVSAALDKNSSSKISTQYQSYNRQIYRWMLQINKRPKELRSYMLKEVQGHFDDDSYAPAELVRDYGTHVLYQIIMGGRCSYSCTIDSSEMVGGTEIKGAAKASFEAVTSSGQMAADATKRQEYNELDTKSSGRLRVIGGDPAKADAIKTPGMLSEWAESVERNLMFVDCPSNGLIRISELIENPQRKQAVSNAIDAVLAGSPYPEPDLNLVPIYKFQRKEGDWCWYFSQNPTPLTGFNSAGRQFWAFKHQVADTVPIYQQKKGSNARGNSFYKLTIQEEIDDWHNKGIAFYAYPNEIGNAKPVYAYFRDGHKETSGVFYSTHNKVKGWTPFPGAAFYIPDS